MMRTTFSLQLLLLILSALLPSTVHGLKVPRRTQVETEYQEDEPRTTSLHSEISKGHSSMTAASGVVSALELAGCIVCIQVLPICVCKDQADCQYVKQSCRTCAHYTCGRRHHSKTVARLPHWTALTNLDEKPEIALPRISDPHCIIC